MPRDDGSVERLFGHPIANVLIGSVNVQHRSRLAAYARRRGIPQDAAEDLVQETFRQLGELKPQGQISELLSLLDEVQGRLESGLTGLVVLYLRFTCLNSQRRRCIEVAIDPATFMQPADPAVGPAAEWLLDGLDQDRPRWARTIADVCGMDEREHAFLLYRMTTDSPDRDFDPNLAPPQITALKKEVVRKLKEYLSGEAQLRPRTAPRRRR